MTVKERDGLLKELLDTYVLVKKEYKEDPSLDGLINCECMESKLEGFLLACEMEMEEFDTVIRIKHTRSGRYAFFHHIKEDEK